ncbi:hypothetical protein [Siphonobacter sp. SORGH_AS_0500]|uniref:hypothetical protein n=1 Tax=Siphonobacter sp. SORGH_AS_0500 TaxID=1864824 RepID=UPI002864E748|nr:hypothetical protein [Siphonobacter sp. SORGH_AS_0500]MDR6196182.1 hypothetical protein [Siphonobacter sp. SORGH_AS_0500]
MNFYTFAFEAFLNGTLGFRDESKDELEVALFDCTKKLEWLELIRPLWTDHHVAVNDVLLDLKNFLEQLIALRL